ncbi:MAG TPA: helix-turn-helix domain-containing protein [Streptosporangiaceae bacterium]|nr:helix-turn-helix domain-containing protein [Streptosporangiaceae bacterium]
MFDDFDGPAVPPPSPDDRDLSLEVVDEITWYMREHRVTRAQLAGAMGVSPGRVSRLLSGGESLTPRTLCAVLAALGARLDITVRPASEPAPL